MPAAPGYALARAGFVVYGVVILAFLAGTLWGNAVTRPVTQKPARLIISNVVAVFAAVAGLVQAYYIAAILLGSGQLALLLYERSTGAPGWYLQLRTRLTLTVIPIHLVYIGGLVR